jgi:hypothetical protein
MVEMLNCAVLTLDELPDKVGLDKLILAAEEVEVDAFEEVVELDPVLAEPEADVLDDEALVDAELEVDV